MQAAKLMKNSSDILNTNSAMQIRQTTFYFETYLNKISWYNSINNEISLP